MCGTFCGGKSVWMGLEQVWLSFKRLSEDRGLAAAAAAAMKVTFKQKKSFIDQLKKKKDEALSFFECLHIIKYA